MTVGTRHVVLRGGQGSIPPLPSFEVYGEDLGAMTWAEAAEACDALDADGGGWRLPTILELRFMYRVCEFSRKEHDLGFTSGEMYWAGDQDTYNPREDGAAALFFAPYEPDGMPGYYSNFSKDRVHHVRCVRTVGPEES
ncbi:MAG: hypothetical protein VYE15_05345 [Myxococcota bacterium]|nr:hypothetical protein [Myxococcota bacterium]